MVKEAFRRLGGYREIMRRVLLPVLMAGEKLNSVRLERSWRKITKDLG